MLWSESSRTTEPSGRFSESASLSLNDATLLHHDADLLRQRRAARRARVHDGQRRRPGALAPADRRRDQVPHRDRRARPKGGRRGRERTISYPRSGPTSSPSDSPGVAGPGHPVRRLHPHDRTAALSRACRSSSAAIYDNGYIYKDIYKGLYCVGCEEYYTDRDQRRRQLSRSTAARRSRWKRRTSSSV